MLLRSTVVWLPLPLVCECDNMVDSWGGLICCHSDVGPSHSWPPGLWNEWRFYNVVFPECFTFYHDGGGGGQVRDSGLERWFIYKRRGSPLKIKQFFYGVDFIHSFLLCHAPQRVLHPFRVLRKIIHFRIARFKKYEDFQLNYRDNCWHLILSFLT